MNPVIRADGNPKFAMVSTLAGAVLNIILDPIFIFVFKWCMMIFACVNKACFIFLQAMGKAGVSTMLSMVREIVFGVGLALILPKFFGLDGVLYSMPVSDILTFIIAAVIIRNTYKSLR